MTDQLTTQQRIPGPAPEKTATEITPQATVREYLAQVHPPRVGNIAKAIAGVMREVGTVQKGGFNEFHRYNYMRMEDLLQAITPLMGKNGLAVIQHELSRSMVDERVLVTYEFSIIHESNEIWPERPRFTGMCRALDKKGGLDDKAINKCHTAARKYFLLSLFQVPAGDLDDADEHEAPPKQQAAQRQSVPGPAPQELRTVLDESKPHRIKLGEGAGADQWANAYLRAIGKATSVDELEAWDEANDKILVQLKNRYSAVYEMIATAVNRRHTDLSAPQVLENVDAETGEVLGIEGTGDPNSEVPNMPDPHVDASTAVNWVAQQLNDFKTRAAAEEFWEDIVLPRDREFSRPDFAALTLEMHRTRARLAGT
jgi:hypothetical protein